MVQLRNLSPYLPFAVIFFIAIGYLLGEYLRGSLAGEPPDS